MLLQAFNTKQMVGLNNSVVTETLTKVETAQDSLLNKR